MNEQERAQIVEAVKEGLGAREAEYADTLTDLSAFCSTVEKVTGVALKVVIPLIIALLAYVGNDIRSDYATDARITANSKAVSTLGDQLDDQEESRKRSIALVLDAISAVNDKVSAIEVGCCDKQQSETESFYEVIADLPPLEKERVLKIVNKHR